MKSDTLIWELNRTYYSITCTIKTFSTDNMAQNRDVNFVQLKLATDTTDFLNNTVLETVTSNGYID